MSITTRNRRSQVQTLAGDTEYPMRLRILSADFKMLGSILAADIVLALIESWKVPFQAPTVEYLTIAVEFGTTHRISSRFLSVGYAVLMGLGFNITHSYAGMTFVNIVISLLMIAAAYGFLRQLGCSARRAGILVSFLSLYPDFLLSYNKVQDINVTALLLFCSMTCMAAIASSVNAGGGGIGVPDIGLAVILSAAVLVRPNMGSLLILSAIVLWHVRAPDILLRVALYICVIAVSYASVTAAVHGRPFLPQNGPYNLFAGYNPYTINSMLNEEDSIGVALADHGIKGSVYWGRTTDIPGISDFRDEQYRKLYLQYTREFIMSHPLVSLKLILLRLVTFLRPDFNQHKLPTLGGWMKLACALGIPLWLVGSFRWPQPGPKGSALIVRGTFVAMVIPFLLTISAPRFAVPLTFVAWMDLGAMLLIPRGGKTEGYRHLWLGDA